MITPLIMLALMMGPYLLTKALNKFQICKCLPQTAAVFGLCLLFLFTTVGHFVKTEPMAAMLPPWVPQPVLLVIITGVLEALVGLAFLIPSFRRATGWLAAIMLLCFLPVNIYAAIEQIPMGGHAWGPIYLLIRIPLQLIILAWIYTFTIRK